MTNLIACMVLTSQCPQVYVVLALLFLLTIYSVNLLCKYQCKNKFVLLVLTVVELFLAF